MSTKKPVLVNQPNTLEFRLHITCEEALFGPDAKHCRHQLANFLRATGALAGAIAAATASRPRPRKATSSTPG